MLVILQRSERLILAPHKKIHFEIIGKCALTRPPCCSAQPFSFGVVSDTDYFNGLSLLEAQFILSSFDITASFCLMDDLNRAG